MNVQISAIIKARDTKFEIGVPTAYENRLFTLKSINIITEVIQYEVFPSFFFLSKLYCNFCYLFFYFSDISNDFDNFIQNFLPNFLDYLYFNSRMQY